MSWLASIQAAADGLTPTPAPSLQKAPYYGPKLRAAVDGGQEKLCTRCDEWWPADLEFFHKSPSGSAGLFYCCKACYYEAKATRDERRSPSSASAEKVSA